MNATPNGPSRFVSIALMLLMSGGHAAETVALFKAEYSVKNGRTILEKKVAACEDIDAARLDKILRWMAEKPWEKTGRPGLPGIPSAGSFVIKEAAPNCLVITVFSDAVHVRVIPGVQEADGSVTLDMKKASSLEAKEMVDLLLPSMKKYSAEGWDIIKKFEAEFGRPR